MLEKDMGRPFLPPNEPSRPGAFADATAEMVEAITAYKQNLRAGKTEPVELNTSYDVRQYTQRRRKFVDGSKN